jgi:hypothetical protein
MNAIALPFYRRPLACNYRPLIMAVTAVTLFGVFWLLSRYPQLFDKARHKFCRAWLSAVRLFPSRQMTLHGGKFLPVP